MCSAVYVTSMSKVLMGGSRYINMKIIYNYIFTVPKMIIISRTHGPCHDLSNVCKGEFRTEITHDNDGVEMSTPFSSCRRTGRLV